MDTFTFQWLVALGFPPTVAAATVAPEIFRADEPSAPSAMPAHGTATAAR